MPPKTTKSDTSLTLAAPPGTKKKVEQKDEEVKTNIEDKLQGDTSITKFRVFSRVRPFIDEELRDMAAAGGGELRSIVEMIGKRTILLDPKEDWAAKSQFEFDESLWSLPPNKNLVQTFADTKRDSFITQRDVYKMTAKGCITDALGGFNTCLLTYGQTGSGKTYTMMGQYNPETSGGEDSEEGIIPRVCHELFEVVGKARGAEEAKPEKERTQFTIEVNFVEIYMEKVRDLLDPSQKPRAGAAGKTGGGETNMSEGKVRQDPNCGPYVEGVTKYVVENWAHCCKLLERGSKMRTTCATVVHNQSSRSHAIFQITILQQIKVPGKDRYAHPTIKTKAGRVNLVDLAGSERGGMTDYVKESSKINASLLALRRVIDHLVERQNILLEQARKEVEGGGLSQAEIERALPQVPYRDSVLTWLLSDSIGGNARTTMLATLSPMARNYGDTLATLQWSSKARNLVTVVKSNDISVTVSDGYSNKKEEMTGTLKLQRANVDSIRGQLQVLSDQVDDTEAETVRLMKATIKAKEAGDELVSLRAAWLIHLFVKKWKAGKVRAAKQLLLDDAIKDRDAADERRAVQQQEFDEFDVDFQKKNREAAVFSTALAAEEGTLQGLKDRKKEQERKQAKVKVEAERLRAKEQASIDINTEKEAAVETTVNKAVQDNKDNYETAETMKKDLVTMEKDLTEALKDSEYESQTAALKKKNVAAADRVKAAKDAKANKIKERDDLKKDLKK